jgi:hypothetical protein
MKTALVNRDGIDYEIKVVQLPDGSVHGGVFLNGKEKVKMEVPVDQSDDLTVLHGENVPDIVFQLLKSYIESGFRRGHA